MKKVKNRITTTYKTDVYDFLIDIIQIGKGDNPLYEAWIYRGSYGVKDYMFGSCDRVELVESLESFMEMVEANMYDYMATYNDKYREGCIG